MRLKSCGKGGDIGVIKGQISIITYVILRQWVDIPAIGRITGLQAARLPDGPRTQPCAGAVGHRLIKRHARDREIYACQIF